MISLLRYGEQADCEGHPGFESCSRREAPP